MRILLTNKNKKILAFACSFIEKTKFFLQEGCFRLIGSIKQDLWIYRKHATASDLNRLMELNDIHYTHLDHFDRYALAYAEKKKANVLLCTKDLAHQK